MFILQIETENILYICIYLVDNQVETRLLPWTVHSVIIIKFLIKIKRYKAITPF